MIWDLSVFVIFFFFSFSTQGSNPHYMSDSLPAEPPGKPKMSFLNSLIFITKYLWLSCIQPLIWLEGEKFSYLAKVKRIYLDVLAFIALSHGCTHIQHVAQPLPLSYLLISLSPIKREKFFFNIRQLWRAFFPPERSLTNCFTKLILRFPPFQ